MDFHNKHILITGASSGLGKALALALAQHNVSLVLVARRLELLQAVQSAVESSGSACLVLQADLSDVKQAAAVVSQAAAHLGSIDIAIMSVGGGRPIPLELASPEQIHSSMSANYGTMVNVFLPLLQQLRKQKDKSLVVQINSMASQIEIPRGAHYSSAKVAAKRFFDTARIELHNTPIKLMTINPGFVQTENKKEKMMLGISLARAVECILSAIRKETPDYSFPFVLYVLFRVIGALPRTLRGRVLARLSDRESGKYAE